MTAVLAKKLYTVYSDIQQAPISTRSTKRVDRILGKNDVGILSSSLEHIHRDHNKAKLPR